MKPQKPAESAEPRQWPSTLTGSHRRSKLAALATPPEPPQHPQATDVDATLLGWAVHFIVEGAWAHLGTAVTSGLLKRTLQECPRSPPDASGVCASERTPTSRWTWPRDCGFPAMPFRAPPSGWSAFLAASRRIAHEVGLVDVREITRLVGEALDHVGFYAAFDAATGLATRPAAQSRPGTEPLRDCPPNVKRQGRSRLTAVAAAIPVHDARALTETPRPPRREPRRGV